MPEAWDGKTTDGYESIVYRTFIGVGEKRYMSWQGGSGRIFTGGVTVYTKETTKNKVLNEWEVVVVNDTFFKLSMDSEV